MTETTANQFRQNLKKEVDRCLKNHDILKVKRKNGKAFVVLGLDDWSAIEETIFLNRIPGMVKSIHQAAKEPLSKGKKLRDFKW